MANISPLLGSIIIIETFLALFTIRPSSAAFSAKCCMVSSIVETIDNPSLASYIFSPSYGICLFAASVVLTHLPGIPVK